MLSAGAHQSANTLTGETAGEAFFIEAIMRKTYAEKLKDPRWQKKRLERLDLAEWECEICFNLNHHLEHTQLFKLLWR